MFNKTGKGILLFLSIFLLATGQLFPYFNYTRLDLGLDCAYWDYTPLAGDRQLFPALEIGLDNATGPLGLRLNVGLGKQSFSLTPDQALSDNEINLTYDAFIPYNWLDSYRMGHKIDLVIDFFRLNLMSQFLSDNAFVSDSDSKPFHKQSLYLLGAEEKIFKFLSISQTYGIMFSKDLAIVNGEFKNNRYRFGYDIPAVEMNTNNAVWLFSLKAVDFPVQALAMDFYFRRSDKSFKPNYDIVIFQQELGSDEQGLDSDFRYYLPYGIMVSTGGGFSQKVSDSNFKTYMVRAGLGWFTISHIDISFAYLYRRMGIQPDDFDVHSTWTDLILKFSSNLNCILKYRTCLSLEGGIKDLSNAVSLNLTYTPIKYATVNLILNRTIPKGAFQNATWPPDNGVMLEAVVHTTLLDTAKR